LIKKGKREKGKKELIRNEKEREVFELNKKIFEQLDSETKSSGVKFILLITDDFPSYYYPVINSFTSLEKIIIPKELNDYTNIKYRYWKASGMLGHWNQEAHKQVAEFLFPYFIKIINNLHPEEKIFTQSPTNIRISNDEQN
jgi:hypothetical protein